LAVGILGSLLATATASGDEILLVGGGKITGTIVEKTKDVVVLETAAGRISVPMRRVVKIADPASGVETYRERAAALEPRDVDGWAALARWAEERGLVAQSREAWKKVLMVDPYHPEAKASVGHAEPDRTWNATEDAYREQGYEQFEGRWVTRAERRALERERATEEAREQGVRESLDAEARANTAESAAGGGDSGVTPARPSDLLPPSPGPRPTETYFTETPPRPDPPPPPTPSSIAPTKPAQKAPPPQGSSTVAPQKDPH
jgi:hypothetical protein